MKQIKTPTHFDQIRIAEGFEALCHAAHGASVAAGWWTDLVTGQSTIGIRNKPEMLMLMVSELAEAMEGLRKNLRDDKLPHRPWSKSSWPTASFALPTSLVPMATTWPGAIIEKMAFNAQREDHKIENRLKEGGKQF